jgi:hypothetical protein
MAKIALTANRGNDVFIVSASPYIRLIYGKRCALYHSLIYLLSISFINLPLNSMIDLHIFFTRNGQEMCKKMKASISYEKHVF